MTKDQALQLFELEWWSRVSDEVAVAFQLYENRLCMPFDRFHAAVEKVLGRGVFTHEFAQIERLREEHKGQRSKPTFEEILGLIPESKRIVVGV